MKRLALFTLLFSLQARAEVTYIVTLTNGSLQPVSPAVIYAKDGASSLAPIGQAPSAGFVGVCQHGKAADRAQELRMNNAVTATALTDGPLMPGEARSVEIQVRDPRSQSVHFEAMYAKTKDACAVGSINGHSLVALEQHVTSAILGTDQAIQSGFFSDPALPMGGTYLDNMICSAQMNAVDCLRSLTMPVAKPQIRFFNPYLSSLSMLLERKYGARETAALNIPGAGAVRFEIKLKH